MWRRAGIKAIAVAASTSHRQVSSFPLTMCDGMGNKAAAKLPQIGLDVALVPCLSDNYCPIIHHKLSGATIIVDTPEVGPITSALKMREWTPTHILNTHHHDDHVGGNLELKTYFPSIRIIGPRERTYQYPGPYPPAGLHNESIPGVDEEVADGDEVVCGALKARVLDVGGHTDGHVAYFFPEVPMVLAGDSLFTMGCGRVFTGNFAKMFASLQKLRALPDNTIVYCAHEYTTANSKFALEVEPNNSILLQRVQHMKALRDGGEPTVPTLIGHEKETNPFLRWDAPAVQAAVGVTDPEAVFTAVRKWKDTGKRPTPLAAKSSL